MTVVYTMHCSSFNHGFKINHVQWFLLENYIALRNIDK